MERIKNLKEYVQSERYRVALGVPEEQVESYEFLAQGEYNVNYVFIHPMSGQKLLLRINIGSQMHLEHQIEYEAHALSLLKRSGRTPKVMYVDGSKERLPYGIMVMEFLPGEPLDYEQDLSLAAGCLADIHSIAHKEENRLIKPDNQLQAILQECEEMFAVYEEADLADKKKKKRIRMLLDKGWRRADGYEKKKITSQAAYRCVVNTELNSTNFLVDHKQVKACLIDWEKAIYGDPAQDLGHFIAPTTTFWKTEVVFDKEIMERFLDEYVKCVDSRYDTAGVKERAYLFARINCLRGITWCAMAWIQYQDPDKIIFNESTYKKLEAYLSDEFLDRLE